MKRLRIIVEGRVQGIGFRYFVQREATKLGINGFVRNLYDGKVEIEAEATPTNLQHFADECKKGPNLARVENYLQSELPPWGYKTFRIR